MWNGSVSAVSPSYQLRRGLSAPVGIGRVDIKMEKKAIGSLEGPSGSLKETRRAAEADLGLIL